MTIHLGCPLPDTSCNQPEPRAEKALPALAHGHCGSYSVLLLAGFAVPLAVAGSAVRSYRTFSPLPCPVKDKAVCFLWHFP
jgi:hypothetical protein